MSVAITMLIYSAILAFAMIMAAATMRTKMWLPLGVVLAMQNRDNLPEASVIFGRADRAARNMLENLVLYGALVLAAQAAGVANENTALGAQLFFWARLVYFPVYVIGIPYLRTGLWAVSIVGLAFILFELI